MAIEEKQLEATEKPESRIEDLLVQVIDMIKSGGSSTEGTQFEPPPQSRDEEILYATLQGRPYTNKPESRIEDLYIQLKEAIETSSGATLIEKSITANGTYSASDDDADGYNSVSVDVPNTYTAGDEGKVVSNGALVAQTAYPSTITENGTYNTTENNSVTVNVASETNWLKTPALGRCIPTCSKFRGVKTWTAKTWTGRTNFDGNYIWTDGENIYYSDGSTQYILDKSTSTWSTKSWTGLTSFYGGHIWTDGENIYYSNGSTQYILDKSTSTWTTKSWTGLTVFNGNNIWTDGENIYYNSGSTQYVLDKSTSTWSAKSWTGLTSTGFNGGAIWTDGENIYYSDGSTQYILDKSTSTWSTKSWTGLTNFNRSGIWTDGENIYFSSTTNHYALNKSTSTWVTKSWTGLTSFYGFQIWTDGKNIYCSGSSNQYVLTNYTIYDSTMPTTPSCQAIASA